MKKFLILTAIFLSSLFGLYVPVRAEDKSIFINEFLPDGVGSDAGKEWVELYNNSDVDISLGGWKISTKTTTSTTPRSLTLSDVTIKSKSFFIIAEFDLEEELEGVNVGAGKLNMYNSNAEIYLTDSFGNIVDTLFYTLVGEGKSLERRGPIDNSFCKELVVDSLNSLGSENNAIDDSCWIEDSLADEDEESGEDEEDGNEELENLPEEEEEVGEPEDTPNQGAVYGAQSSIVISEVYPSPNKNLGENEWLEIYNQDISTVNLSGMYFKERAGENTMGSSKSMLPNTTLAAGEYLVINENDLNISLNNSGDSIFLIDANDTIVDNFIYNTVSSSESAARIFENGLYRKVYPGNTTVPINATPTPGTVNFIEIAFQSDIQTLHSIELGILVKVSGYINSSFEFIENDSIYIQDIGYGVRVMFDMETNGLSLDMGRYLEVEGRIKLDSSGFKFIEVKDLSKVQTLDKVELSKFLLNDVDNFLERVGIISTFYGELYKNNGTTFYLRSENKNIKVRFPTSAGTLPSKTTGDYIEVSGLLIKDGEYFTIIPNSSADVKVFSDKALSEKTSSSKKVNPSTPSNSEILGSSNLKELNPGESKYKDVGDKIYSNSSTQNNNEYKIYPWPAYLAVSSISFIEVLRSIVRVFNMRSLL